MEKVKPFRNPVQFSTVNKGARDKLSLMGVPSRQTTPSVPTHLHFFCHLLWEIHGGTLAVVVDFLDLLRAVWRPGIMFELVPIHLGSERSVEHLALSAHIPVCAFVPFVSDVRPPPYASDGGAIAAEATRRAHCGVCFCFWGCGCAGALPFSKCAVVVEDPLSALAVPPTIFRHHTNHGCGDKTCQEKCILKLNSADNKVPQETSQDHTDVKKLMCAVGEPQKQKQLFHRFNWDTRVAAIEGFVLCKFAVKGAGRSEEAEDILECNACTAFR